MGKTLGENDAGLQRKQIYFSLFYGTNHFSSKFYNILRTVNFHVRGWEMSNHSEN